MRRKEGFTLAEVLITLAIIGVVAAITVPTLVQNIQDAGFRNKFKKEYSVLNAAYTQAIQDNGGDMLGIPVFYKPFQDKITPYLHTTTICSDWHSFADGAGTYSGTPGYNGPCFASTTFKLLNNNNYTLTYPDESGAILNDGATFVLGGHTQPDCSGSHNYFTNNTESFSFCAQALIDVNGYAPPNQVGRDIYAIFFLKDKIIPFGTNNDSYAGTCKSSSTGWGCAASVLKGD